MDQQEKIDMLKSLVEIDTSKTKNIKPAMTIVRNFALSKGFSCRSIKNTSALLIETNLEQNMKVGFVAHIDVVPAMDWEQAFVLTEKDDKLYARGVVDDKGPLVVCLATLVRLKELMPNENFGILVVSDEENANEDIHEVIAQNLFRPEFAIVVDGGTYDMIDVGEKGTLEAKLIFETIGGHSGFEKSEDNAALAARDLLNELSGRAKTQTVDVEFSPTFVNVSRFEAIENPYGMPSRCVLNIEIQFPIPQTSEFWKNTINELANKYGAELSVNWANEPHVLSDERILGFLKSLPDVKLETIGGHGLAKDLHEAGITAICHCPIKEYNAHCVNENLEIDDLRKGEEFYTDLAQRYIRL